MQGWHCIERIASTDRVFGTVVPLIGSGFTDRGYVATVDPVKTGEIR